MSGVIGMATFADRHRPVNECAFCGPTTGPLTIEDVIPRWLSKFLRRTYKHRSFTRRWRQRGPQVGGPEANQRMKTDAPVVCLKCNRGWMSELEDFAKPILVPLITHPAVPARYRMSIA